MRGRKQGSRGRKVPVGETPYTQCEPDTMWERIQSPAVQAITSVCLSASLEWFWISGGLSVDRSA